MKFYSLPHKGGRGGPATARDSAVTSRLPERTILAVDEFAVRNGCTRSDAVRRLVEIGLAKAPKRLPAGGQTGAAKASELASKQIDRLIDPSATDEEGQKRKHRILKGPAEFRDMRKDRPSGRGDEELIDSKRHVVRGRKAAATKQRAIQAKDAPKAAADYAAAGQATRDKTAQLRAQRLAREAAAEANKRR